MRKKEAERFPVGSNVRIVYENSEYYGKIGIVSDVTGPVNYYIAVITPDNHVPYFVSAKSLELVPQFKVGDRVRIARKVTSAPGWKAAWVETMDRYIGREAVIHDIDNEYGIGLKETSFYWPPSALELVTGSYAKKEPPIDPRIAEETEAARLMQQSLYELRRAIKYGKF